MSGAMKVSEFMLQLAKKLMDERKIAESTSTQYLQTLHKLNGGKPFNNLAWAKKFEAVQAIIDGYAPSTQGNQYMVLSSALSLFNDKATYKGAYNHWRDKMMEARKEKNAEPIHEKNEKQEENWLTWEEVSKKKSALKEDISSFLSNKVLTTGQFDKLLQFVILSLYSDVAPRRNQDYLDMYVVKKLGKDVDATKNYYDLSTHKFIFNKYKTAKTYGQQEVAVPDELQTVLGEFLKHHPLAKGKTKEFKLLVKADGSNLNTVNAITRCLNRIFGKKVGSSMLRHSYLSSKYGDATKEMEDDAEAMGHSTSVQKEYIKH
jgi:integrase